MISSMFSAIGRPRFPSPIAPCESLVAWSLHRMRFREVCATTCIVYGDVSDLQGIGRAGSCMQIFLVVFAAKGSLAVFSLLAPSAQDSN